MFAANTNLKDSKGRFVILQNNKYKICWEIFILIVLLATTIVIPIRLAFVEVEPLSWNIAYYCVDGFFTVDIFLQFLTSYTDEMKQVEVVDLRSIASNYLRGWFVIDFLSVVPIQLVLDQASFSRLVRFARIGKMYKMLKIFRLIKILKLVKQNRGVVRKLSESMQISTGMERLAFFTFFFSIFLHVSSCLFIMLAAYEVELTDVRWIDQFEEYSQLEIYITSCYYVLTTTSTVGYGDITPQNTYERLFGMVLMLVGVLSFTFISGALSSILATYDSGQASL
jgi:hypothetical protein